MLKKITSILVTMAILLGMLPVIAWAEPDRTDTGGTEVIKTTAQSAILLEYHSGQVMFSKTRIKDYLWPVSLS